MFPRYRLPFCRQLACSFILSSLPFTAADDISTLKTIAEATDFEATSSYAQTVEFCESLTPSPRVELTWMGKTHEGRNLPLLVLSRDGISTPADATRDGRMVVFAMANIHAGEVCGKEALLMLARELSLADQPLLDNMVVLLAPIYNADGNERFALDNRPGQVGPARGMGQRPNAQGLDLNRDNIKHESPESRALAQLIADWQPAVCIDTHTTNGSHHRYTITYDGPRHPSTPGKIADFARDTFLRDVGKQLRKTGYESFFYGNFNEAHDRWDTYPDYPRYCTHYFGMRGTVGVLSEAYAYASFKDRVLATRDFVRGCLLVASNRADEIRQLLKDADAADAQAEEFPIDSIAIPYGQFDVLGYVEEEQGGETKRTDEPATYQLTYYGTSRPTKMVDRPFAYAISKDAAQVVDNLESHGIQLRQLDAPETFDVETYTLNHVEIADEAFQGHRTVTVQQTTKAQSTEQLPAGTWIVKTHQPMLGALIVNLLEPEAIDGLCAWNFFDDHILEDGEPKSNAQFPVKRIVNDSR